MISKIYSSNIPIFKADTLKGNTKKEIETNFNKQNSFKRKINHTQLSDLEKYKKRLIKRYKQLK
jgi:hypothetical protein